MEKTELKEKQVTIETQISLSLKGSCFCTGCTLLL